MTEQYILQVGAKLCMALQIDTFHNGLSVFTDNALQVIATKPVAENRITPRIGYAQEWQDKPLRFVLE